MAPTPKSIFIAIYNFIMLRVFIKGGKGVVIEGGDWVVKLLGRVQFPVLLRPSRGFLEDPMRHIAYVGSKIEGRGFKVLGYIYIYTHTYSLPMVQAHSSG